MSHTSLMEEFALGAVLSSNENNLSFDDIVEALYDDVIPDGVTIWRPFEHWELYEVAKLIQDQYDVFNLFATRYSAS